MGEWGKFTGYKKASRLPAGFLLIPTVVGEASYGGIKYPKRTITWHAAENRNKETRAERKLFFFLITHRGGILKGRFRRQHIIGGRWIVDFFFADVR